jgi:excisionase family DNA binding protein
VVPKESRDYSLGRSGMKTKPLTISVPEAGRRLGIGRNAAYEAAHRGELPVVRFGRLLRVPLPALDRMLQAVGSTGAKANSTDGRNG